MKTIYRFIFAGGGTGGHLYPALAVAQKVRQLKPEAEILFVGTKNKIEAKVVPQSNFNFKTILISGFSRKFNFNNLLFPFKLTAGLIQSLIINMNFKPRVAIGTGAYVSGPVIWAASVLGAKIILLEQNSYPGITNRLLEKKADEIHLTYEESKKYFRYKEKLFVTGNPVRVELKLINKEEALKRFSLQTTKKTLLVLGGSLGAKSINNAVAYAIDELVKNDIQILWQTGKLYFDEYKKYERNEVRILPFIDDMQAAYSACDLVLARAGATTIAEVSFLGLPVIFVPSTNVAANHQILNAKVLVENNAALMIEDNNLQNEFLDKIIELINNEDKLNSLRSNIKKFSKPDAADVIAERIIKLAEKF
ncbi:undecaprenyldiphospho-muramoylpentapeptide beta-N-acetylglucosaminyltransferase [Rosettibacter firmus]|uniref:undecaprenyldiphospho-muramoylpentapeptide beta-N-acetylglucosaminyltransferase n=1 Tax=Rosettibacter firmus TaxID=3111522 RepID=UPI00336C1C50